MEILIRTYRLIISPKLDYRSIVYGSATRSSLSVLNAIPNIDMRMGAGAFKTSPISSLQILCNEPALEVRREDLSMRYFFRYKCFIANPVHSSVVNQQFALFFGSRPNTRAPFIICANSALAYYDLPVQPVLPHRTPFLYSWTMKLPTTAVSIVEDKRNMHESRLG